MRAPVAATRFPAPTGPFRDDEGTHSGEGSLPCSDSEVATAGISSWRAISNNALPPQAELAASRANAVFALREARQAWL